MTTTAHEDQFTDAPEPVRQMYSIVDILRRNVADLEIALLKQTERAEKAEEELKELREQVPLTFVHDPNGYAIGGTHTEIADALPVGTDLYTRPVPAPAVPDANPVQWLEDEGDMILVPRGLLGAACSSIDKQRPAPKVLEALRYYTMNAQQAPDVPAPAVPEFCAVEAQLTLAETEMLNAKAWSAGTQAKRHIDFAMTAICCARDLLQSRAVKDSLTTQADCRACVNRGRVNGLSQETYCESCVHEGRNWRKNHFLDAAADRLLEGRE